MSTLLEWRRLTTVLHSDCDHLERRGKDSTGHGIKTKGQVMPTQ
jgi:hypothetical protein